MRFAMLLTLVFGWSTVQAAHLRMEVGLQETYEKIDGQVYQLKSARTKVVSRLKLSAFTLFPQVKEREQTLELNHKRLVLDQENHLITYQILDGAGVVVSETQFEADKQGRHFTITDDHTLDYVKQAYVQNPYGQQFTKFLVDDFYDKMLEVDVDDIKCIVESDYREREVVCKQKINFEQEL